jgi:hypothetical protein
MIDVASSHHPPTKKPKKLEQGVINCLYPSLSPLRTGLNLEQIILGPQNDTSNTIRSYRYGAMTDY